jgi:hypothetical protein
MRILNHQKRLYDIMPDHLKTKTQSSMTIRRYRTELDEAGPALTLTTMTIRFLSFAGLVSC